MTKISLGLLSVCCLAALSCQAPEPLQPRDIQARPHQSDSLSKRDDVARDADGRVHYMHHAEATQYCENIGRRLPSVAELAQFAQSMGAVGISTSKEPGYESIVMLNDDGQFDQFYYSNAGYKAPKNLIDSNGLWSSSIYGNNSKGAYFLNIKTGELLIGKRDKLNFTTSICVER